MKKILFLALMLFAASSFGQSFQLSLEVGQGFKFKDYHNPQFYLVSTAFKPGMNLFDDRFNVTAPVMTLWSDGYTYLFTGSEVSYIPYDNGKIAVSVGASALFGSEGRELYGGNLRVKFNNNFYLFTNIRQEHKRKELWFDGGIAVNLIQPDTKGAAHKRRYLKFNPNGIQY